jgi:hypothetical protein
MKLRLILLLFFTILLFSCSPKLDDLQAVNLIRQTFQLTDSDKVAISGISPEAKGLMIIKFEINGESITSRARKYDKGWQLEEYKNYLGMWIPISAIVKQFSQEEKQIRTMTDIIILATGLVDYITDNNSLPDHAGPIDNFSPLLNILKPYSKKIPQTDRWGNYFEVYSGERCKGQYGLQEISSDGFIIVSLGSDGKKENWKYDPKNPKGGLYSSGDLTEDLVNWSGSWIRAPKRDK